MIGEDDEWVKKWGGRIEVFNIAEDEQLIGCKLDERKLGNYLYFSGVTWLKIKVRL